MGASPEGTAELCAQSAVPSGLIVRPTAVPNVETLGYCRQSLRDKDLQVRQQPQNMPRLRKTLQARVLLRCCGLESPRSILESAAMKKLPLISLLLLVALFAFRLTQ